MVKIKICGITRPCEADWLNEIGTDYAGFVFFPKSRRNVSPENAKNLLLKLNKNIKKVSVLVSPTLKEAETIGQFGFDILQLHGEISDDIYARTTVPLWRAVNLTEFSKEAFLKILSELKKGRELSSGRLCAVLFDAGNFGSGKTFGWESEHNETAWQAFWDFRKALADMGLSFFLAGGLHPGNAEAGIRLLRPDGVDVSSGVEADTKEFTGKSREKIKAFVNAVRETETNK